MHPCETRRKSESTPIEKKRPFENCPSSAYPTGPFRNGNKTDPNLTQPSQEALEPPPLPRANAKRQRYVAHSRFPKYTRTGHNPFVEGWKANQNRNSPLTRPRPKSIENAQRPLTQTRIPAATTVTHPSVAPIQCD